MSMFEQVYQKWLKQHIQVRNGERKQRILRGLGHGEIKFLRDVWLPVRGSLDQLHPEYEVLDHQGKPRFLDFAYVTEHVKLGFEIEGFGPHARDVSRWRFADERKRIVFLIGMGWRVCPIAYDDLEEDLESCRFLLQLVMGKFLATEQVLDRAALREKEVLRFMMNQPRPVQAKELADAFGISRQTARRILLQLRNNKWIQPANISGKGQRIHRYVVNPQAVKSLL